ncbi:polyamine ABC transporter substrate-binding protein [Pseudomonas sp. v388]|uniref:polyamine ABC transporter substrate-binding protein n=1 Tax=Pseudomonas sp. v388 TaxID=2479849 RepID=UPI000F7B2023|nr:polyamine ABC transporter substrate-binding protein [Pseudomonas sp. v388]RRV10403.1 polyamine ABC transporter substrate-binding protein [Pseudomonas sp. v388]
MLHKSIAALMLLASTSHAAETVNVYNWTDYVAPNTVKQFEKTSGVKVIYETYDNNDTLNAALVAGRSGYDVVVPSVHYMARQVQLGVLKPLDKSRLPNWKNLNPVLLKALQANDPGNRHGFPYLWGSTGIGYDAVKVKAVLGNDAPVDSWDLILKPENMRKLSQCGVAILDSAPELLPITLNYLGLSPFSESAEDYAKAGATLGSVRPYVTYFHPTQYIADLAAGKICVAVGYSGDISQARDQAVAGVDIHYSVPREGAPMWFDMMAMPADAANEQAAYAFMNYLLKPDVIAEVTNHVHYANGNEKAEALIDPKLWTDPSVYPDADVMSRMFVLEPVAASIEALRVEIWNRFRTGK